MEDIQYDLDFEGSKHAFHKLIEAYFQSNCTDLKIEGQILVPMLFDAALYNKGKNLVVLKKLFARAVELSHSYYSDLYELNMAMTALDNNELFRFAVSTKGLNVEFFKLVMRSDSLDPLEDFLTCMADNPDLKLPWELIQQLSALDLTCTPKQGSR